MDPYYLHLVDTSYRVPILLCIYSIAYEYDWYLFARIILLPFSPFNRLWAPAGYCFR